MELISMLSALASLAGVVIGIVMAIKKMENQNKPAFATQAYGYQYPMYNGYYMYPYNMIGYQPNINQNRYPTHNEIYASAHNNASNNQPVQNTVPVVQQSQPMMNQPVHQPVVQEPVCIPASQEPVWETPVQVDYQSNMNCSTYSTGNTNWNSNSAYNTFEPVYQPMSQPMNPFPTPQSNVNPFVQHQPPQQPMPQQTFTQPIQQHPYVEPVEKYRATNQYPRVSTPRPEPDVVSEDVIDCIANYAKFVDKSYISSDRPKHRYGNYAD